MGNDEAHQEMLENNIESVLDKDTTIGTITQELKATTEEELTPGGTRKRA
mgnify:CR=1 FL=1